MCSTDAIFSEIPFGKITRLEGQVRLTKGALAQVLEAVVKMAEL
jgi:hypothetical protein